MDREKFVTSSRVRLSLDPRNRFTEAVIHASNSLILTDRSSNTAAMLLQLPCHAEPSETHRLAGGPGDQQRVQHKPRRHVDRVTSQTELKSVRGHPHAGGDKVAVVALVPASDLHEQLGTVVLIPANVLATQR